MAPRGRGCRRRELHALPTELQAALWALGGVPEEHRTDSLSAAFNKLAQEQELAWHYANLCRHYGMRASRCNRPIARERLHARSKDDQKLTGLLRQAW